MRVVSLLFLAVAANGVMDLTDDTFTDVIENSGKNVFVKFFAPWCGHCKRMKPDWDKLGEKFEGSSSVIIADVDCTANQKVCSDNDVGGYPTVKYFTAETGSKGDDYQNSRSYEALEKFVKDKLEKLCDVSNPEDCSEKEQKFIEKMKTKDSEYISGQITRLTKMKDKKMTPALKTWLFQRLNIFKQLASAGKDEL
mmetsp:Transcript_9947/g.14936  ORF Transcript_9947/g.14936 Transcript_9947/m.14936 type:complete len:196 (+) Transcript_9947:43-630(+)|eukprot:CAMPEP_0167752536 /NCGR_PEP_ID=MMETSP0110_2-20121227/7197_1 /TAXON_ID=629695 /ORGANISM="Gymnochlora sp., Strain CCMP2014" /LENGTH=195 /DNA_ID=CAMNT_0007638171 /DNA_START=38 /DNA_END=625 /DNA_ORIENTATION=-